MIATVLVGPGKPKLVQIQRPSSSHSKAPSQFNDTPIPATPVQAPAEVSAFSPYDTPCHMAKLGSCLSTTLCASAEGAAEDASSSSSSLIPQPLQFPFRRGSSRSDSRLFRGSWQRLQDLADPFGIPLRKSKSHRTSLSIDTKWTIGCGRGSTSHFPHTSPTTEVATWSRCRKMERILTAVTKSINSFPDGMHRLDSPVVLELRSPHLVDQTYIDPIQKIFPQAPFLLLSALVAWILVDIYLSRLTAQPPPTERCWDHAAASNESLHRIPEKAREMLGIGLPDAPSIRLNEYALRRRAAAIHARTGEIGQRLVEALRGSWDDDIWRSLKVLIEVIEASPRTW